jgi:general secretion pathway protein G
VRAQEALLLRRDRPTPRRERGRQAGFTVVELLVALAIVGVLSSIGIAAYRDAIEKARIAHAIAEIRGIERVVYRYEMDHAALPDSLADVGWTNVDPWNNPYEYLRIDKPKPGGGGRGSGGGGGGGVGQARKDRFLVPINSDFDLYSMGADGRSVAPLTAKHSRDDIVRAANGAYVGLAAEF